MDTKLLDYVGALVRRGREYVLLGSKNVYTTHQTVILPRGCALAMELRFFYHLEFHALWLLLSIHVCFRYYPYYYAPFASDLKDLPDLEITFFRGNPFKPFDQLMGTLPAASSGVLPEKYRRLMTDPSSPIFEFYPSDFEIDMNGKRFAWQGVAKLPFIDEWRLLSETKKLEDTLTEEERFRNSVMFDLLYVHPLHPLATQNISYYSHYDQMPPNKRLACEIDTNASGGMNGFLGLCERNGCRKVIASPVHGLQDIVDNRVLNATFLNPWPHKHIPEPPKGVHVPEKVLRSIDIKPFPALWHEENGARRHQGRERPQVPGAISGPMLGEAAHRLLKNSLNIKPNQASSGLVEQPSHRNPLGNHVMSRPRPAGPPGYEKGFCEDSYNFYGHYNPQGIMARPRFAVSPYELQGNRQMYKAQDRYLYQEQAQNLGNGISDLTIESGIKARPQAVSQRIPNSGKLPNMRHQFVQNIGPLSSPPPTWISKPAAADTGMYFRQEENSSVAGHEKQVKKVYQVKNRLPQNSSDPGFQQ